MAAKSFLASATSGTDLTTYTFSAQTLGTAAGDRYIVLVIGGDSSDGASKTVSSVTVQGITATLLSTQYSVERDTMAMAIVAVPTGTTGDIVVTWSATMRNMGVGWWRVTGLSSATPYDFDGAARTGDGESTAIDIPSSAIAIAGAHCSAPSLSWTGLTEDFEDINEFSSVTTGGASGTPSAQSAYAISWVVGASERSIIIAASWGDAPSGPANLKTYNTNVKANIKSIDTNLIANVKTLNTNA